MNNQKTILDDSQLVGQYINGNEAAFEELVNRHKSRIFTTIHMIVKDQYVAGGFIARSFHKSYTNFKIWSL